METGMNALERNLKGLADATRLRIINLLAWGELCGCDIQRVLEASQSNISRHLTYLKHAGLVTDRREGFRVFYQLVPAGDETLKSLFEFLTAAFRRDESYRDDLRRLRHAIKDGACMAPPARVALRASSARRATLPRPLRDRPARNARVSEPTGPIPKPQGWRAGNLDRLPQSIK
jgi:ArsR family transcriptional regulator, arsenate/arsenite/antimonite-responsive transcriptional repressor